MNFFFDTEFLEDGRTIDLISIGIVREDGEEYYAQRKECNMFRIVQEPWLVANVLPTLGMEWKPAEQIANEIIDFVGVEPTFWAWYADYDWVALCQLYGRMIDLPMGWPMYCRDLKQWADDLNYQLPKQASGAHNALEDAKHNLVRYRTLKDYEREKRDGHSYLP